MTPGTRAIFDALCFDGRAGSLANLTAVDLAFTDRTQLTPLLSRFELPAPVRDHVDAALARNAIRVARAASAYDEIASAFDHVLLKGSTHVPDFADHLRVRVQYDLDLYAPPADNGRARDALLKLGYEPISRMDGLAMDHLPTMVRKTGWQWRGDYFDPDLPVSVEIHFQFWDERTERLPAEDVERFWTRRQGNQLALVDRLGYAALHLTRHLLRGNIRPFHVWEIARFLHTHHDPAFWRHWLDLHSPSLRRLEAVAFLLANSWFACSLPEVAAQEIAALPDATLDWFDRYQFSPIEAIRQPNKHELWLHMSLLDRPADRWDVLRRRLVPASLPGPVDAIHLPNQELTPARRLQRAVRNSAYAASRALHHVRLLVPTMVEGAKWWLRSKSSACRRKP